MASELIDELPLPQRLALAYAPAAARPATLALFALDARLGQAVRQASEPIMAQMRLAWWRDQLKLDPTERERHDKLMAALDLFAGEGASLGALVDGWELLLSEELACETIRAFASGRAQAFLALRRVIGADDDPEAILRAGQRWALGDLAAGLSNMQECGKVLELHEESDGASPSLSRSMRPLSVLGGLAGRSLRRGGGPLLDGPASGLAAIRLGLIGR